MIRRYHHCFHNHLMHIIEKCFICAVNNLILFCLLFSSLCACTHTSATVSRQFPPFPFSLLFVLFLVYGIDDVDQFCSINHSFLPHLVFTQDLHIMFYCLVSPLSLGSYVCLFECLCNVIRSVCCCCLFSHVCLITLDFIQIKMDKTC